MIARVARLGVLGVVIALLAVPAAGTAKKKANPCAKKKAEKTGCVLKGVLYGNASGDALFGLQSGSFEKPVKTILTVAFNDDVCVAGIRTFDLRATAYPKIGTTLKLSRTLQLDDGSYVATATATFTAKAAKVSGKAIVTAPGQPECSKSWSATIPRTR